MGAATKKTVIKEINIKNNVKALIEVEATKELSVIKASEVDAVAKKIVKMIDIKDDSGEESGEDLGRKSTPLSKPGAPRPPLLRDLRLSLMGSLRHGSPPLTLPYPRRFAERATQGRGISHVIAPTCDLTSSAPANADSSPCNDKFLALTNAGLLETETVGSGLLRVS